MVEIWLMSPSPARREWLRRSLAGDRAVRVAGSAATFAHLRSMIGESEADLALIDLPSPVESSRDWLVEIVELVPVLLLSPEPDAAMLNRMLHQSAGGILSAEASPEEIVQAIQSIALGLTVYDSALGRGSEEERPLSEPLTSREREVLALLAGGLANKEIAAQLNVSEHTIKFHIHAILGKLGASSRTEAVSRGLRTGLIDL